MDIVIWLHSKLVFVVLIFLALAALNAFWALIGKRSFGTRTLRLTLFALIFYHIQLLTGIASYFVSPYFSAWENGVVAVMKDSTLRLYLVEHPATNILAILPITMGWSLHKKTNADRKKHFRIAIFYGIGLFLISSRIPWNNWP